jgi:hypothetical protein
MDWSWILTCDSLRFFSSCLSVWCVSSTYSSSWSGGRKNYKGVHAVATTCLCISHVAAVQWAALRHRGSRSGYLFFAVPVAMRAHWIRLAVLLVQSSRWVVSLHHSWRLLHGSREYRLFHFHRRIWNAKVIPRAGCVWFWEERERMIHSSFVGWDSPCYVFGWRYRPC